MDERPACLLTGGTGFLGRHLVTVLTALQYPVLVFTRKPAAEAKHLLGNAVEVIQGDIRDASAVRVAVARAGIVFHLAGAKREPDDLVSTNIEGTRNVAEASASSGVQRLIHVSSVGVMGNVPASIVTEDSPARPSNAYEQSKYEGEEVARGITRASGVPMTIVRPANVFGEHDPERQLLTLMRLIRRRRFAFVGEGRGVLNYVYAADVAEACRVLAERRDEPPQSLYLISDPAPLREFVAGIAEELGVSVPRRHIPVWIAYAAASGVQGLGWLMRRPTPLTVAKVASSRSRQVYSPARLREAVPGWPPNGWRTGIRRTVVWYRSMGWL